MITRGEHRHDRTRRCPRCGLPDSTNGGLCPPGYWMTADEFVIWDKASPTARLELEKRHGALLSNGTPDEEKHG